MFVALALAAALPQIPNAHRDVITSPSQTFVMLAPQVASAGNVKEIAWSPDGRTLAILRSTNEFTAETLRRKILGAEVAEPAKNVEVLFWNLAAKTAQLAFRGAASTYTVGGITWIGSSSTVIAQVTVEKDEAITKQVWLIKPSGPRVLELPSTEQWGRPSVSGMHDIGVVVSQERPEVVRFFNSAGQIGKETILKEPAYSLDWNGATPTIAVMKRTAAKKTTMSLFDIDPRTGALSPSKYEPHDAIELATNQIQPHLTSTDITVGNNSLKLSGTAATYFTKRGETGGRSGFVGAEATLATVAPGNKAIAYVSQGLALVRELVAVPREAYERIETMDNAKQVGFALLIYSADADDEYPPNDNWQERTNPYIKDMSLLKDFTYLLNGGKLPANVDPSKVVIGYMLGGGGKAVVYGDGSVRWEKP